MNVLQRRTTRFVLALSIITGSWVGLTAQSAMAESTDAPPNGTSAAYGDISGSPHPGFAGAPYEYRFALDNVYGHLLMATGLPNGLSLDQTGLLSGVLDPALSGPQEFLISSYVIPYEDDEWPEPIERSFTLEVEDEVWRPSGVPPLVNPSEGQPAYHFHFALGAYTRVTSPNIPNGLRLLPGGLLERDPSVPLANGRHTIQLIADTPAEPRPGLPESTVIDVPIEIADFMHTVKLPLPRQGGGWLSAYRCPPEYPYMSNVLSEFVNPDLRGLRYTVSSPRVRINTIPAAFDEQREFVIGTDPAWIDNFEIHEAASATFTWHCTSVHDRGNRAFVPLP